jgi:hypothetical protein
LNFDEEANDNSNVTSNNT